jgi:hypothetical protein
MKTHTEIITNVLVRTAKRLSLPFSQSSVLPSSNGNTAGARFLPVAVLYSCVSLTQISDELSQKSVRMGQWSGR